MNKPDRSTYTSTDFSGWKAASTLSISPKFQRRGVWNRSAQSYFIDTLILGMPVPPIYLRVIQSADKKKVIREVVDGQQRLTAVLTYLDDEFTLANNIESDCKGKRFSELSEDQKNAISQYSFICEVFHGMSDSDVLKVFQRLNTYSVKLNAQELRNGQFFGQFKAAAYSIAYDNIEFWRNNRLFSERDIARMREVEFVSEALILLIDGMQDKKKSITTFYEKYDNEFLDRDEKKKRFNTVVDTINETFPKNEMSDTEFRRVPIFYGLFAAIAHRIYSVKGMAQETPKKPLSAAERTKLRDAVLKLSEIVSAGREDENDIPKAYDAFVTACLRQTDNLKPRQLRTTTIYEQAFG